MATVRPPRAMDPYAAQFWEYTLSKELRLQKCSECAKYRWPPGPTCGRHPIVSGAVAKQSDRP